MTDLPSPSVEGGEPTTETGRALLTLAENHNLDCADPAACCFPAYIADGERILAIEAEASAQPAPPLDVEEAIEQAAPRTARRIIGRVDRVPHPECIEAYHGELIRTGRTIMSVARVRALVAASEQPTQLELGKQFAHLADLIAAHENLKALGIAESLASKYGGYTYGPPIEPEKK